MQDDDLFTVGDPPWDVTKFKIGDKVRIIRNIQWWENGQRYESTMTVGEIFTISKIKSATDRFFPYHLEETHLSCTADMFELVTPPEVQAKYERLRHEVQER